LEYVDIDKDLVRPWFNALVEQYAIGQDGSYFATMISTIAFPQGWRGSISALFLGQKGQMLKK
jgi:hypothetical protein